jgi:hypothetical protein
MLEKILCYKDTKWSLGAEIDNHIPGYHKKKVINSSTAIKYGFVDLKIEKNTLSKLKAIPRVIKFKLAINI